MSAKAGFTLEPDRAELSRFINALFMHANEGGMISVRAFYDDELAKKRKEPAFRIRSVRLNGGGLEPVTELAFKVTAEALKPTRPVVVCPPICTFGSGKADEKNLLEGLVLSVELDERPKDALAVLRPVIGPPTLVVESGGEWADPENGEVHQKLHIHWRLAEPTQTLEEHARLKRARTLACELVGADATSKSTVHPLRWAGTWHRKNPDAPKLARIVEEDAKAEIILEDALAELEGLAVLRGIHDDGERRSSENPTADGDRLMACAVRLPNPLPPAHPGGAERGSWADWNRIGMAFWRASSGSEAGFEAFDTFSRKNAEKYDPEATRERWRHFATSPPTGIGMGTLVYEVRRVEPDFLKRKPREEAPEQEDIADPASADTRPKIQIWGGGLHLNARDAAAFLGEATYAYPFDGFYRRGNLMVRPVRLADADELNKGGIRRARGSLVIASAEADALRLALTALIQWERFDGRQQKWVSTDAPSGVAKALLATAQDWADIPILTGIVEAPTLRSDGTVLDRPGYDPATGLLFDPGGTEFPRVPNRPTKRQAGQALALLLEVVAGFPFVDGPSKSVGISGLMTPRVRKACRAVPLHAITAPKMASGKTLLATISGYLSSGRAPAMMSQADDPTDERKRILAVLIEGQEVSVIDNVERELKSDALCSILTEPRFSDRLLGASKTVTVPSASTWFVTGNNLVVVGDLTARAISCALDPRCERPEEREFNVDLHKIVPERRAELAVACLTITRAYLAAGEPKLPIPNFARFEGWSRFVRQPLVWLGMEDPCKGRERIEGRDPVRAQLGMLLEAWNENYPGESATVAEAIKLATREPIWIKGEKESDADQERRHQFFAVMREIAGKAGDVDSRILGNFIAKHERRIEDCLMFESRGLSHKVTKWRVTRVDETGGYGC